MPRRDEVLPKSTMATADHNGSGSDRNSTLSMLPAPGPLEAWQSAFVHVDTPKTAASKLLADAMAIDGAASAALLDAKSNLAMARRELAIIDKQLDLERS